MRRFSPSLGASIVHSSVVRTGWSSPRPRLLSNKSGASNSTAKAPPGATSSEPLLVDSPLKLPFRFETGIGLFAKRPPRPFPPPFLSPPSGSFSDPLSTHHRSRVLVNGELIRGRTNGDDAVYASEYFVGVNDGVGAWSQRPKGHAGLWSRLILHFWAAEIYHDLQRMRATEKTDAARQPFKPDPVRYLQRAYEQTLKATAAPNDWQGTTTATGAQLYFRRPGATTSQKSCPVPILLVTNLGDSQVMVIRPSTGDVIFKTKEQWHWFDCPRQLGTNSPDTPVENAVVDEVEIREGDIVLAMSDGVIDNLWEHEIVENVTTSLARWEKGERERPRRNSGVERACGASPGMQFVAEELMNAARVIALDPFAESPFMEHALEEGLASPGGKLDDISVVAALCRKNG